MISSVAIRLDDRCVDVRLTTGKVVHVSFDVEWVSHNEFVLTYGCTLKHLSVACHKSEDVVREMLSSRITDVVYSAEVAGRLQ